jgi:hypothetical protein
VSRVTLRRVKIDKLHRNELFRAVERGGIDPSAFAFTEGESLRLRHKESEAELRVRRTTSLVKVAMLTVTLGRQAGIPEFRVFTRLSDPIVRRWDAGTWEEVVKQAYRWVDELKQDLSTPDFWSTLPSVPPMDDSGDTADNSPFSATEKQAIADRAALIKREAKDRYSLNAQQIRVLESKLDYVVAASERLGRLDWRNLVAGVFLDMMREAILPQETTQRIFQHLGTALSHALGHPLQLGPL